MVVRKNQPVTWSQGELEQQQAREILALQEAASFSHARILSGSSLKESCREIRPLLGGSILRSFLLFKARPSQGRSYSLLP